MLQNPIFIGGAARSGTTLMRVMLDAHANICCGAELKSLGNLWDIYEPMVASIGTEWKGYGVGVEEMRRGFQKFVDRLTANFLRATGKKRWAEKTPQNAAYMLPIGQIFPDAKFIHMIRDGRDVASSLVSMNWRNAGTGKKQPWTENVSNAARYWRQMIEVARSSAAHPSLAGRVLNVKYEMLVETPEATMRTVLDFLGEPWDPAVLEAHKKSRDHEPMESSTTQVMKPIYRSALGRWKLDLSPADVANFEAIAGETLRGLGYK